MILQRWERLYSSQDGKMCMKPSEFFAGDGSEVYDLLHCLGVTARYTGFFQAAYAIQLATRQPERLLHVTKWLYPDVAKHYGSNVPAVERNIRTVVHAAWYLHPELLEKYADQPLQERPTATMFLSILTRYLLRDRAA